MTTSIVSNQIGGRYPYNQYVDGVLLAADAPIFIYYNGPNNDGIGATMTNDGTQAALVIDGNPAFVGQRILYGIESESLAAGIYIVTDAGSISTNWVLTRVSDYNLFGKVNFNDLVHVDDGATEGGSIFIMRTSSTGNPFILGQSGIQYSKLLSQTATLYDPGFLYGLELVPINNTTFTISSGYTVDSTNLLDLILGSTTINFSTTGVNGLDTGSIGASANYCVYLIGDSTGVNPTAGIVSLGTSGPTSMPAGYNKYRFIGNVFTNGSSQLYKWTCKGKGNVKEYYVDFAVDKVILSSGSSTSQTSIGTLSNFIPNTGFVCKIKFQADFSPGVATDYARITPAGFVIATQVASVILGSGVNTVQFLCSFEIEPGATSYQIDYLVDNVLDNLTLAITGFTLSL